MSLVKLTQEYDSKLGGVAGGFMQYFEDRLRMEGINPEGLSAREFARHCGNAISSLDYLKKEYLMKLGLSDLGFLDHKRIIDALPKIGEKLSNLKPFDVQREFGKIKNGDY